MRSFIVWRKELLDSLRDGRTVFLTLALPLLLYPALFSIIGRVQQSNEVHQEQVTLQVAVSGLAGVPALRAELVAEPQMRVVGIEVDRSLVLDGIVHVMVNVPARHEASVRAGLESEIVVYYDATHPLSRRASGLVEDAIERYRREIVRRAVSELGGAAGLVDAQITSSVNVAEASAVGAVALSTLVPYLLVLLIASGASHTAIDSTAGEKERSTLETVLVSGASRTQLIFGKFLAALTVSSVSGLMGFLGLAASALSPTSMWHEMTGGEGLPVRSILILLGMMTPIAALLSAVFLALGCFARGMREGQTFASYVIIFVIMLAVLSVMVESELGNAMYMVPVMGTMVAQRQLLTGSGDAVATILSLSSTLASAALALFVAVKLFADERVMFRP